MRNIYNINKMSLGVFSKLENEGLLKINWETNTLNIRGELDNYINYILDCQLLGYHSFNNSYNYECLIDLKECEFISYSFYDLEILIKDKIKEILINYYEKGEF